MIHEKQIILNRGDYTTCSINVMGGTVTSWKIHHEEQLFASRENQYTGLSKVRGGINLAFPHFGMWSMGPPYGFTRDLDWHMEEGPGKLRNGDVWALMTLNAHPYTDSVYKYDFKLSYKITLCESKLIFNIYVENRSKHFPMEFQILQHASFKVPDVSKSNIIGFYNCEFVNHQKSTARDVEERKFIAISQNTDRLYINAPFEFTITNMTNGGTLKIIRKSTCDVNIWNPWDQKGIRFLGDDEYQYFIAVEAGRVVNPIRIEPLSCWQARHIFEITPKKEKQTKVVDDYYDLFNDYC